MDVLRRLAAERADERRLQLRVRAMVGAADDVRDLEVEVVDCRGELVGRRAVGAQERRLAEAKRALGVGLADQVRRLAVAHVALALAQRPFVPADAEPLEVGDDRLGAALDVPRRIGVVDPQQEAAAVLVGEAPVRDRAQRAAEMQRPGRARREADSDHQASVSSACDGVLVRPSTRSKRLVRRFRPQRRRKRRD